MVFELFGCVSRNRERFCDALCDGFCQKFGNLSFAAVLLLVRSSLLSCIGASELQSMRFLL